MSTEENEYDYVEAFTECLGEDSHKNEIVVSCSLREAIEEYLPALMRKHDKASHDLAELFTNAIIKAWNRKDK